MTTDKWIKELKVGDKVYTQSSHGSYYLATVASISPKRGDISVQYRSEGPKTVFGSDGIQKTDGWNRDRLMPYNGETTAMIEAKKQESANYAVIAKTIWREVSADKLARIAAILREE